MIHFEFTLEDAEAEALFDCIHQEITQLNMQIISCMAQVEDKSAEISWYKGRKQYLLDIIAKMQNKRC